MSIQVLSAEVINQIAAGEVVERPAHLVKELIENSIDAGANEIIIETGTGGRWVKVSDNGHGIQAHDLSKAVERHATSKINASGDLWNLHTFGFRGEALASIAAVSNLTLQSFHKTEKKPSQISVQFGAVSDVRPSSRSEGTEIKIENLFENVPARLKFLKSETSETQQIKAIVKAVALAHPNIQFKLIQDGDLQFYFSAKDSLLGRARDVLGSEKLFYSHSTRGNFSAEVVFSSPHDVVKTSRQIWIFAQNRFIQDRSLQAAVMDAYRSLLMHGEYPQVVVKLNCKPDEIDVNIHPTKSQVKFQDPSTAFRCVHGALREALEKAPWIVNTNSTVSFTYDNASSDKATSEVRSNLSFYDNSLEPTQFKQKNFDLTTAESALQNRTLAETDEVTHRGYWSSLQVLGQANLTYIICQKQDRIIYVDQHAAHERVVFESLMQSFREKRFEIQSYLFPYVVDLSEEKVEALLSIETQILDLGIQIERLGPISIGIKSAPHLIKDAALPPLFDKIARDVVENGGSYAIEKKVGDIFASMACHSVVRAGQSLSISQMEELLISMDKYALSSFCPHGRPVSVETTFQELDKLFGRIT